jgi:hypothetical protein
VALARSVDVVGFPPSVDSVEMMNAEAAEALRSAIHPEVVPDGTPDAVAR